MATQVALRVADGDGHISEDSEAIHSFLPEVYRRMVRSGSRFPPLDHLHSGRAVETPPQRDGRGSGRRALAFLEDVGLEWTVLYPTSALAYGKIVRLDYAVALCRAYEDTLGQAEHAGQYDLGKLR